VTVNNKTYGVSEFGVNVVEAKDALPNVPVPPERILHKIVGFVSVPTTTVPTIGQSLADAA
jgi:hypothetical protein